MAPLVFVLACGPGDRAAEEEPEAAGGAAPAETGPAGGRGAAARPPDDAPPPPVTEGALPPAGAEAPAAGGERPAAETGGQTKARVAEGEVDWMQIDEAKKQVTFEIVAGKNPTNGAWNFNGYANGDLTITVPRTWSVMINFTNRDANVPHSILVSDREPPFPNVFEPQPAIPRAYSAQVVRGLAAGREDTLRFTAEEAGKFTLPCGVPGHAASGMWDWFVVSADAARPTVSVAS